MTCIWIWTRPTVPVPGPTIFAHLKTPSASDSGRRVTFTPLWETSPRQECQIQTQECRKAKTTRTLRLEHRSARNGVEHRCRVQQEELNTGVHDNNSDDVDPSRSVGRSWPGINMVVVVSQASIVSR
mmetsp:Transcript_15961/g.36671  ORF Transcript_15961/g.36671 Transcript_15961/m.36671 type:complete len:127 (+) Transcript_15961:938-1318(+)